ncbi:MAG: exosortase-associated EpsI family protein [Kiritimatiellae bacterium]|nr:exosortase-associated EpsI family protein [Kiritimatiellia bacterium]
MEKRTLKPYFVLIVLFVLTSLALALTVDVNISDEAGIAVKLPDLVGGWRGEEILYCQGPGCGKEFVVGALENMEACPLCGGPLGSMSLGEKTLLPSDTIILKKRYTDPLGKSLYVSIVLSGKERASIHRPQVCLVGQGNEIVGTSVLEIPMDNRGPLEVMVLDMLRRFQTPDQRTIESTQYYAYWFVGKGRETPYHVQRMIWMATDRIFHNISHRWAYIAVWGLREPDSDAYREQIKAFIHDLYPLMAIESRG